MGNSESELFTFTTRNYTIQLCDNNAICDFKPGKCISIIRLIIKDPGNFSGAIR
jgi:hypothetical protein